MISEKKLAANRANALRSTGPKTAEGKAASSANSLRHGLTTPQFQVFAGEDQAGFDQLHQALIADLKPRGALQRELVLDIAQLRWKLKRVPQIENQMMAKEQKKIQERHEHDRYIAEQIKDKKFDFDAPAPDSPAEVLSGYFVWSDNRYVVVDLYRQRLERSLLQLIKQLRQLKKETEDQIDEEARINEPTEVAGSTDPGIGYRVDELIAKVKQILGTDKTWNVLLIGAGNLGRALMAYRGFDAKGFRLVAVFDNDPAKVGKKLGTFQVQPLSELAETIRNQNIRLAMLAVPADFAQDVANQLVAAGVRGLLNFAPVSINVPPEIALNAVDLAVQLEQISFQVSLSQINKAS